jgi:hypothetical protein
VRSASRCTAVTLRACSTISRNIPIRMSLPIGLRPSWTRSRTHRHARSAKLTPPAGSRGELPALLLALTRVVQSRHCGPGSHRRPRASDASRVGRRGALLLPGQPIGTSRSRWLGRRG